MFGSACSADGSIMVISVAMNYSDYSLCSVINSWKAYNCVNVARTGTFDDVLVIRGVVFNGLLMTYVRMQ